MNPQSTAARRGKIARLSAHVRRQLNLRLENNQPADSILPWLNNLPETSQILAARYAALLNSWDGEITPEFEAKIKFLRGLSQDITRLQKSLHSAAQQNHDLKRLQKQDAAEDLESAKKIATARLLASS